MPSDALVLLPPSESKQAGGSAGPVDGLFDAELEDGRLSIRTGLRTVLRSDDPRLVERTLGVRGPLLERALQSSRQLLAGRASVLPAWQRYEGVVWSHLDPSSLTPRQRSRIWIPSGLYGLNAADDMIADYRLTMKVTLPGVGNIASFWRTALTRIVEQQTDHVISMLPKEHEQAFDFSALTAQQRFHSVTFVQADGYAAAGHDAKAVKGIVAGIVLRHGLRGLVGFTWRGWTSQVIDGELAIVAPSQRFVH